MLSAEAEVQIGLLSAGWHRLAGDPTAALPPARAALRLADRCGYRLLAADAHLLLARLALDGGDRDAARRHAEQAREQAWCDGPPECYRRALDEAEALLAELT